MKAARSSMYPYPTVMNTSDSLSELLFLKQKEFAKRQYTTIVFIIKYGPSITGCAE